jgi:hypothetical protein
MVSKKLLKLFLLVIFIISFLPLIVISYSALESNHRNEFASGLALFIGTGLVSSASLIGLIVLEIFSERQNK